MSHATKPPSSIEQLLALAAVDPAFSAALQADRARALAEVDIDLTPMEARMLGSLPPEQLEQMIDGLRRAVRDASLPNAGSGRRAFMGGAAATLLGALASSGCEGGRVGVRSAVADYRRKVEAGGGGGYTGIRPGIGYGIGAVRRPRTVVKQTRIEVAGSLPGEIVRRIMRRHINELRYCFESKVSADQRKKPVVVTLVYTVDATGQVRSAAATRCSIKNSPFSTCLAAAVRRWKYPSSRQGKPTRVDSDLSFEVIPPTKKKPTKKKPTKKKPTKKKPTKKKPTK